MLRNLASSLLRVRPLYELQTRGYPVPDFSPAEKARTLDPGVDPGLVPPPKDMRVVKHATRIPPTPPGEFQHAPFEKQEYQLYDHVEEAVKEHPPVKVILLKSVDGVGRRGDVVDVPSDDFHNSLFPTGCAIYATPYDLKLLEKQRLAGEFSKLEPEDMLNFEYKKLVRLLNNTIVPITMTFDDKWTLEKRHLRINLRRAGFFVSEENIVLPREKLQGPNKNLQGKLVTFYVKHTQHCIVPVVGRIDQVSAKGHHIIAVQDTKETESIDRLIQPIHYSLEPIDLSDEEIQTLMLSQWTKAEGEAKKVS